MAFFRPSVMGGGGHKGPHIFKSILGRVFQISSQILLLKTLKSLYENIWNDNFRKFRALPDKLVAMVTPDNLGNQKQLFLMLHRLILKVTKFQLPPPKRLKTVIKNILEAIMPPMSNRVKPFFSQSNCRKTSPYKSAHNNVLV